MNEIKVEKNLITNKAGRSQIKSPNQPPIKSTKISPEKESNSECPIHLIMLNLTAFTVKAVENWKIELKNYGILNWY